MDGRGIKKEKGACCRGRKKQLLVRSGRWGRGEWKKKL